MNPMQTEIEANYQALPESLREKIKAGRGMVATIFPECPEQAKTLYTTSVMAMGNAIAARAPERMWKNSLAANVQQQVVDQVVVILEAQVNFVLIDLLLRERFAETGVALMPIDLSNPEDLTGGRLQAFWASVYTVAKEYLDYQMTGAVKKIQEIEGRKR